MHSKEMERYLEMFRNRKKGQPPALEQSRAGMRLHMSQAPLPDGAVCELFTLAGLEAERITVPGARTDAVLFFIHGGGFINGSVYNANFFASRAAVISRQTVISISYRLAPEHQFSDGLSDCIRGYEAILASGVPAENITVSGDSAGGYMSLSLTMWLKANHRPMPGTLALLSPAVGFGLEPPTKRQIERDCMLKYDPNEGLRNLYFRDADMTDPVVNPIIGDFTDFPPVYIAVSTDEILYNNSLALAKRLGEAGVECCLHIASGLCHGYQVFAVPEAAAAAEEVGAFVRPRLRGQL